MGVYKRNSDGSLREIASNTNIMRTPQEGYVTEAELIAGLATKQDVIQYETLPTASIDELGNVYQYVGTTNVNYTHGYFYECVSDGATTPTYSWIRVNVQPNSGGGTDDYTDLANKPQIEGVTLSGNKTASNLGLQAKMQLSTMPTASTDYLNRIIQYTGTTNSTYTNGYFYKCISDGGDPAVYSWIRVDIQPSEDMSYIIPQNFGAVGDGVTDDTDAIVAAENEARRTSKVLYFPSGIYKVQAGAITCHSGMTWIGEEKKSIIVVDQTATDIDKAIVKIGTINVTDSGNDVAITGLTFRGSETHGSDQSGISILDINYAKNIFIRNCVFQNNKYAAIRLIRVSNIKIFDCDFEATDCGVVSLGSYPTNDVIIKRCHFTGVSSFNSFTNYFSECITVGNNAQSDACERWTVEDCIFEQKHTNAVSFTARESPLTDKIHTKDSVVRNCTFRGVLGAVYIGNSENVSVDGIFVDDTPKEYTVSEMHRVIMIVYSKHITVRNVTSKCTELYQSVIRLHSGDDDILIDGIDAYNVHRSSNESFAYLSGNNITIKNVVIHPVSTFTTAYISCLDLTNSYVDVAGNVAEGLVTKYWRNSSSSTVTNNTFIVHTEDATNRTWEGASTSTADTNKWILVGDGEKDATSLSQVNLYNIPKILVVSPTNSSQLDTIGNLANFTLMQDGYDFFIAFKSSTYANEKSASFNTTGNIIPIDKPFTFSNDYKVVCHFVQKNAKWVEVKRELEYYEGATIDATQEGTYVTKESTQRYNVLDYGLVGDNSTDNSTAFEALLAQLPRYGTAVIYFPQGRYRFSRPIVINDSNGVTGVTLMGDTVAGKSYRDGTSIGCPDSTLIYTGNANTTFIKGGDNCWYFNVHGLHLSCIDGFNMTLNDTAFSEIPYNVLVSSTTNDGIIGIGNSNGMDISNCIFSGFSGSGLETAVHTIVRNCTFYKCKVGIGAQYDTIINDCWFNSCGTAIIAERAGSSSSENWSTLIMNDTWVDECTRGIYCPASQITMWLVGVMFDMFDEAAIYCEGKIMNSLIVGHIQRAGMKYADIADADRTIALAHETDAIVANEITNTKIDIASARRNIGIGNHSSGICPSRLVTAPTISNSSISDFGFTYEQIYDPNMVTLSSTIICGGNNNSIITKSNTLPTANAGHIGETVYYMGTTDQSAGLGHGCIYECVSDGASTPTYSWKVIGISLEMLQNILTMSNDFNDFKTLMTS